MNSVLELEKVRARLAGVRGQAERPVEYSGRQETSQATIFDFRRVERNTQTVTGRGTTEQQTGVAETTGNLTLTTDLSNGVHATQTPFHRQLLDGLKVTDDSGHWHRTLQARSAQKNVVTGKPRHRKAA